MANSRRKVPSNQIKVQNTPTPVGDITNLGYDSLGQLVNAGDIEGGTSTITDLTYTEAESLVASNSLVTNNYYIINDFVTKHTIPDVIPIEFHTHDTVEPLLLRAISTNEFAIEAKSLLHPKHILRYRFDLDTCEGSSEPRKGMIVYREDPETDTKAGYDYLGVVYRRFNLFNKSYEVGSKVDDTNVLIATTATSNVLNNRRRFEVSFDTMTHSAGEITATFTFVGSPDVVKPLIYHVDMSFNFPANYLSGKKGSVIYNPELDGFIFMGFIDIGSQFIGQYLAPTSANHNIGHGIRYVVDGNDFQDLKTFENTHKKVSLPYDSTLLGTVEYYPNIVFFGSVNGFFGNNTVRRVNFTQGVTNFYCNILNNVWFGYAPNGFVSEEYLNDCLFLTPVGGFGTLRHKVDRAITLTLRPALNFNLSNFIQDVTLVLDSGSNVTATAVISESHIFIKGMNVGSPVPNNFYITAPIYRSLLGYLESRSLTINKPYNNKNLWLRNNIENDIGENLLGYTHVNQLRIDTLQAPVGNVTNIGIDEDGRVVQGEGVDATGFVTVSGPTQVIEGQKEFDLNVSTKQAFHLEDNIVLNRKAGYASINYHSSGNRFYFGRPDEIDSIHSLANLTASRIVTWPDQAGEVPITELITVTLGLQGVFVDVKTYNITDRLTGAIRAMPVNNFFGYATGNLVKTYDGTDSRLRTLSLVQENLNFDSGIGGDQVTLRIAASNGVLENQQVRVSITNLMKF